VEIQLNPPPLEEPYPFYRRVVTEMRRAGIPFLLGGSFALACLTAIRRSLKDLDILVRRKDWDRTLDFFAGLGMRVERTHPHWLGKAVNGNGLYVDVIYASGNGLCAVDDGWFERAIPVRVLDNDLLANPVEEMIWSKSYVMERDRYDGADVAHLFHAWAGRIDWERLLSRFGGHGLLLFSHVALFDFIYPDSRDKIPQEVREELAARATRGIASGPPRLCRGTLLSALEYEDDITRGGYNDARLAPYGNLTAAAIRRWTEDLEKARKPGPGRLP
jgi:hypothetical protein